MNSSKRIFVEISDADPNDPNVEALIRAVDMWPLPLTLLANQAQYISTDHLLRQWNERKTKIVTRGFAGRLSDLDVSIQISLESERFRTDPGAMKLLQVLSILPDGTNIEYLHNLLGTEAISRSCLGVLLGVGLVSQSNANWAYCLCPIREHVAKYAPIDPNAVLPVLKFYTERLAQWRRNRYDPAISAITFDLVRCQGNIRSVIMTAMNYDQRRFLPLAVSALYTAHDIFFTYSALSPFLPMTKLGLSLARKYQDTFLEAMCLLTCLCHEATFSDHLPDCRRVLDMLKASYRNAGDRAMIYMFLYSTALDFTYNGQFKDALECLDDAPAFCPSDQSPSEQLQILKYKIRMNSRMGAPTAKLVGEAEILINKNHLTGFGTFLDEIQSACAQKRGMLSASLKHSNAILARLSGNSLHLFSVARIFTTVAHSYLLQSRIKDTAEAYSTSYRIFEMLEKRTWMSTVCGLMGSVFTLEKEFEAAQKMWDNYVADWGMNLYAHIWLCRRKLESDDCSTIDSAISEAEAIHSSGRNSTKQHLWVIMGDRWMQRKIPSAAITAYIIAAILYGQTGQRVAVAMCIQRLGDAFFCGSGDAATAKACYQATLLLIKYLEIPRHHISENSET